MAGSFEIKGVKESVSEWSKLNKEFLSSIDLLEKQILSADKLGNEYKKVSNLKGFTKFANETKKNNDAINKSLDTATISKKKLEQATKQLEIAQSKEGKELTKVRLQVQQLNKQNKQSAEISLGLVGSYKKLSIELNQIREKAKNAGVTFGTNSKVFKKLSKDANVLDAKLKGIDRTLGQSQRNVGNYRGSLRGLSSSLIGSLGIVGGVTAFVSVVRSSFKIVKDFDKQQAVLAGVLRKTRSEISDLTEDAKRLGSTTAFTASEVGQLQEAYARLGFSQKQILNSTEATLNGALALQAGLGDSAELVGSVLNQFSLDASESGRVVDILAKSTQISALNFSKLQTALPIVGKTAQKAGVSLEETASLLGVLASNGIDASSSATALRNIYLKLADNGLTFEEALSKINNSQNQLNTASKLFGTKGATVAVTLAENTEKVLEYETALIFAGGSAEKLANEQLNTLDGSLKLLKSAWEGYILGIDDASGASSVFQKGIKFLGDNLKEILDGILFVVKAFGLYKAVVIGISLATKGYTALTIGLTSAKAGLQVGLKSLTAGFKALNTAQKANVIGVIVVAIYAAVEAFEYFNAQLTASEKAQSNFNEITKKAKKNIANEKSELELLIKVARNDELSKRQRLEAIKKINAISPEYLGNITLENINTKETNETLKDYIKVLNKKAIAQSFQSKRQELYSKLIDAESSSIDDNIKWYNYLWQTIKSGGRPLSANVDLIRKGVENRKEEVDSIKNQITALDDLYTKKIAEGDIDLGIEEQPKKTKKDLKEKTKDTFRGEKQVALQLETNKQLVNLAKELKVDLKQVDDEILKNYEDFANKKIFADKVTKEEQKNLAMDFAKETAIILGESFGVTGETMTKVFDLIKDGFKDAEDVIETIGAVIGDVMNSIFEASNQRFENQLENNEKEKESALSNASLTNEQREYLEEKYDKKKRDIQKKQAQAEKKQAIFQIALNTAMGIAKAVALSPLTFGLPFSAYVAALGAIQIAAVASRKVPEFWKGTENAPEGVAKTDERGAELHLDRYGRIKDYGSDKGARYKWLDKGDKIITAEKTKNLLKEMSTSDVISDYSKNVNPLIDYSTILNAGGSLSKNDMHDVMSNVMKDTLAKQPKNIVSLDKNGINKYYRKGNSLIKLRTSL